MSEPVTEMLITALPPTQVQDLIDDAVPFTAVRTTANSAVSSTRAMIVYDLEASVILGRDNYRLTTPFKFYVGKREDQLWAYLPAGFLSDGATVPRMLYWIVPPWGRHGEAAMVHDHLCEHLTLYQNGAAVPITRAQADQVFNDAMKVSQVNPFIRHLMYGAVRMYAWYSRKFGHKADAGYRARKTELEAAYDPATFLRWDELSAAA